MSHLVGNPEDRFSHDAAQLLLGWRWLVLYVCLFDLILNIPVNSYSHVGIVASILWDLNPKLECHEIQKVIQIQPTNKGNKAYMYRWFYLNHFPGQAQALGVYR